MKTDYGDLTDESQDDPNNFWSVDRIMDVCVIAFVGVIALATVASVIQVLWGF